MTGDAGMRDVLRQLDLFEELSDGCLDRLVEAGSHHWMDVGDVLVREGGDVTDFKVMLDGRIEWSRQVDGQRVVMGGRTGLTYAGAITLLTDEPALATGTAVEPTHVFRIPGDEFRRLLQEEPTVLRSTLRVIAPVQQAAGRAMEQREKLVALGTLSAGLAHELNNPAAAARRSAQELGRALEVMQETIAHFVSSGVERTEAGVLVGLQREALARAAAGGPGVGAIELSELEDTLVDAIDELGFEGFRLAPPLAEAGLDEAWLERVRAAAGDATGAALEWVAASLGARALADELTDATERISGIVSAVRDYTQMDRAGVREIDVRDGLESTLTILAHKLKRGTLRVERDYADDVPPIMASASQLNQVWTNLIDNAIDAIDGDGTISVSTRRLGDRIEVCVADDGPGVPPEIQARVFEPFFTTKDVGEGTGLGLDVSLRIVRTHGGELVLDSVPGRTRFAVRIPIAAA